jgi:hypothetical protein
MQKVPARFRSGNVDYFRGPLLHKSSWNFRSRLAQTPVFRV